jgi:hypothetical protein
MTLLAVLPKSRTDNLKGRGATLTLKRHRTDWRISNSAADLLICIMALYGFSGPLPAPSAKLGEDHDNQIRYRSSARHAIPDGVQHCANGGPAHLSGRPKNKHSSCHTYDNREQRIRNGTFRSRTKAQASACL